MRTTNETWNTTPDQGEGARVRILAIPGSLRRGSQNRALLRAAQELAPAGVEVRVFGLNALPPYDGDVEAAGFPEPVRALHEAIRGADALLIATPEYNGSIPGVLKNVLDWASRPYRDNALRGTPAAVVGASTGLFGAVWAQAELRKVLRTCGALCSRTSSRSPRPTRRSTPPATCATTTSRRVSTRCCTTCSERRPRRRAEPPDHARPPTTTEDTTMAKTITRDELKAAIDAGEVTVVETLRTEHFEQGHLPGAVHIHFEEVADKAPALLPDKDAPIVTYCSNTACRNSEAAANQLAAMGYTNVRKYAEGKQDWTEAGLPLETGAPA